MSIRYLEKIIPGLSTSDGAGVRLRRSIGQNSTMRLDPFLMLDEFSSDQPDEYISGFPAHPHRGFETVTYMLDGHMLHEDHMGNKGHLKNGDVQWMTAGRGIIHSEMPQQDHGLMRGFQLWINLPAKEKMKPASYRDIPSAHIPVAEYSNGVKVKVIAGTLLDEAKNTIEGVITGLLTEPVYLDIHLPANQPFHYGLPEGHNAFVYVYEGSVQVGDVSSVESGQLIKKDFKSLILSHQAGVLSKGTLITLSALDQDSRLLLLAGKPLNEPIAQRGPFVMNTVEEIQQAMLDYQRGELVELR
ncbi:MAG: pirin family protein [Pseudomonadota bacterium]